MSKDYYQILEIPLTATTEDIKKAYRKQALRYHPDKNQEENAEELFKVVGEAYRTLSNTSSRQVYNAQQAALNKQKLRTTTLSEEALRRRRYDMKASLERMLNDEFREKFRRFFGLKNPYDFIYDANGNLRQDNLFDDIASTAYEQVKATRMAAATAAYTQARYSTTSSSSRPATVHAPYVSPIPVKPTVVTHSASSSTTTTKTTTTSTTTAGKADGGMKYERYWNRPGYRYPGSGDGDDYVGVSTEPYVSKTPRNEKCSSSTFSVNLDCPCTKCKGFKFNL